jgi:hypothetical protein
MKKFICFLLAFWWGLFPVVVQGIGFTQFFGGGVSSAAPSYVLKDSNTGTSTGSYTVTFGSSSRQVAGSFQPATSYTIKRIDVYLEKVGSPSREITCSIWSTTGTTPNAQEGVVSASVNTSTFPTSEGTVTFYPELAVTGGTTYHIALTGTSSNSSDYFRWHRTGGSFRVDQAANPVTTWSNLSTSNQIKFAAYAYE